MYFDAQKLQIMKKCIATTSILLICFHLQVFAQDGTLDTSFGTNGAIITDYAGDDDWGRAVAINNDKIFVGGYTSFGVEHWHSVGNYFLDGSINQNFGGLGFYSNEWSSFVNGFKKFLFLPDGTTLVGGTIYPQAKIVSLLPSGEENDEFGSNGHFFTSFGERDIFNDMFLDTSNEKIIFTGTSLNAEDENSFFIIKLDYTGAYDSTFGSNGIILLPIPDNTEINETFLLDNNHVLVSFIETDINDNKQFYFSKFDEDGLLDTSFGANGIATTTIEYDQSLSIASSILPDGKIIVLSQYEDIETPANSRTFFNRYLPNGAIDTSYGTAGTTETEVDNFRPEKIKLQANGKMIVKGKTQNAENVNLTLLKFTQQGVIDPSFGNNGSFLFSLGSSSVVVEVTRDMSIGDFVFEDEDTILCTATDFSVLSNINITLFKVHNSGALSVNDPLYQNVVLFPNPSDGIFKVNTIGSFDMPYTLTDLTGKQIFTGMLSSSNPTVDLSSLQNGMYFLVTSQKTFKLLKK